MADLPKPLEDLARSEISLFTGLIGKTWPNSLLISTEPVSVHKISIASYVVGPADKGELKWEFGRAGSTLYYATAISPPADFSVEFISSDEGGFTRIILSNGVSYELHKRRGTLPKKDVTGERVAYTTVDTPFALEMLVHETF